MIIDFTTAPFRYRLAHCQGRNELIAKAIGYKKNTPLTVFDTTAGLGQEAFLLASLGCTVTLFERHPVVAQALKTALDNAQNISTLQPIIDRMKLIPQCAIRFFQDTPPTEYPDVIYCDPMFSQRKKSAAVKKALQTLRTLVGHDPDAEELVHLACRFARKRVVVKRPHYSDFFCRTPDYSLEARSHRFDVYTQNR